MSSSAAGKEGTSLLTVKPAGRLTEDTETHVETPLAAAEPTASGLAATAGAINIATGSDAAATLANAGHTAGGDGEQPEPSLPPAAGAASIEEKLEEEYDDDDDEDDADADGNPRGGAADGEGAGTPLPGGLHHLTRHWLPEEERGSEAVLQRFGADSVKAAEQMIKAMGQRQLREAFQRVYGSPTASFNNQWLRRKLGEALGLRAAPVSRGRGAPRRSGEKRQALRAAGGGGGARGRAAGGAAAAVGRAARVAQERERREREEAEATAALHETADALLLASCELDTPWVEPLAASASDVQVAAGSERQQQAQQVQEAEHVKQSQQAEQHKQRLGLPQQEQQQEQQQHQQQERAQSGTDAMPSVVLVGSPSVSLPASRADTPARAGFAAFQSTLTVPPLPAVPSPAASNQTANAKPSAE